MSFEDIALSNPKGLALSLSTAMYTTVGGVVLFLVSAFFHFVFEGCAERLENRLDQEFRSLERMLRREGEPELQNSSGVIEALACSIPQIEEDEMVSPVLEAEG